MSSYDFNFMMDPDLLEMLQKKKGIKESGDKEKGLNKSQQKRQNLI